MKLKVTYTYTAGNILKMVQHRNVVSLHATEYRPLIWSNIIKYEIVSFPMTLSDLQGHSPIASVFKC